jgi:hypothetical protein
MSVQGAGNASELEKMKAALLVVQLLATPVADVGQIPPNVSPAVRQWFRDVHSPAGMVCCDVADGHLTDYDIRPDGYWVPIEGRMWHVPPQAVIKDSKNPFLTGVVWWRRDTDGNFVSYYIRCFTPGGGS